MGEDRAAPALADIGIGGIPSAEPQLMIHKLLDAEGYSVIVYSKGRRTECTVSLTGETRPVEGRAPAVEGFCIYRPDELPQPVQAAVASMVEDFRDALSPAGTTEPERERL